MPLLSSFVEEAKRLGAKLPPSLKNPYSVAGMLAGGLAAYDVSRGLGLHSAVIPEEIRGGGRGVDAKKWVAHALKGTHLSKPVLAVTTPGDITEMLKDSKFGLLERTMLQIAAKRIVTAGSNAGALKGNEKFYLVMPPVVNPRVAEHEFGHLLDDSSSSSVLMRFLSMFFKAAHEKAVMVPERKAWEEARKTPLKEKALDTYESGFHRRRAGIAGRLSALLMMAAASGGEPDAGGIR